MDIESDVIYTANMLCIREQVTKSCFFHKVKKMANLSIAKSIFQSYSEDFIQSVIKRNKSRAEIHENNQFWKDIKNILNRESGGENKEEEENATFKLPSNKVSVLKVLLIENNYIVLFFAACTAHNDV